MPYYQPYHPPGPSPTPIGLRKRFDLMKIQYGFSQPPFATVPMEWQARDPNTALHDALLECYLLSQETSPSSSTSSYRV